MNARKLGPDCIYCVYTVHLYVLMVMYDIYSADSIYIYII